MKESFLRFLWKNQLFHKPLRTEEGNVIDVLSVGFENRDAGPDFFNAKIKIGGTVWIGNVEIHIRASDWYKHGHHLDKAYDNTILHVVAQMDRDVFTSSGRQVFTVMLKYDKLLEEQALALARQNDEIKCLSWLESIEPLSFITFLQSLSVERLEKKAESFMEIYNSVNQDWDTAFFILLSKYFGARTNSLPFVLLAKSFPFKLIDRLSDNLTRIQALLFGQSGLLEAAEEDDFVFTLKQEYMYLRRAYNLKPIKAHLWKFLRLRPANFPSVRIAQISALLFSHSRIFDDILNVDTPQQLFNFFDVETDKYWDTHYKFGKESVYRPKRIGKTFRDLLMINAISVAIFAYGTARASSVHKERAVDLLEGLKAESNSILSKFQFYRPANALESQALMQLYDSYCSRGKCLECPVGMNLVLRIYKAAPKSGL